MCVLANPSNPTDQTRVINQPTSRLTYQNEGGGVPAVELVPVHFAHRTVVVLEVERARVLVVVELKYSRIVGNVNGTDELLYCTGGWVTL